MALLDFIKNRNAQKQQAAAENTQPQKTETAKEMYARQAVEEKANRVAPTPDQEQRAQKIGEEMRKATQHREQPSNTAPTGSDEGSSNSAQRQKGNEQGKAQEALSPTDDAKGKTADNEKQPVPEKSPEKTPPTVARRPPSWER